jgi:hypothetical protein
MELSRTDAAEALRDIERAHAASRELRGYEFGGSYLIVWGLVWLVAGSLGDLLPGYARAIWSTGDVIGVAATIWLTLRLPKSQDRRYLRRGLGLVAITVFFAIAVGWVLSPAPAQTLLAFFGLMTGTAYMVAGLWAGMRYLWCGIAVVTLSLGGYALLSSHYQLWFAVACGGALILGGWWMRKG